MNVVVADSSPLNYLALLSDFDLLRELYGSLIIPPEVYREVVDKGLGYPVRAAVQAALGKWIEIAPAPDVISVDALRRECRLDLGETEAIVVAESLGCLPLLMDEQRAVRCARSRSITVIRTPLIYADAKILGLIGSVKEKLDQLNAKGFRLKNQHYEQVLRELGEL